MGPGVNTDAMMTNDNVVGDGIRGRWLGEGKRNVGVAVEEESGWGQGQIRMSW